MPGLVNGTAYTFTVTAVNAAGSGPESWPSSPVQPQPPTVPTSPPGLLVSAGDGQITAQWAPPADGGSDITGYTVTTTPATTSLSITPDSTTVTITGLTNGTAYTVSVVAANKAGQGKASTSDPVTPAASRPPGQPTNVRAGIPATGSIRLDWSPPADPGSSAITGYTVTANPGGASTTTATPGALITGLDSGTAYTFTVTAANAAGAGPASATTPSITPLVVVNSHPAVLSQAAIATLQAVHPDGTLVFKNPPAEVTGIRPGTLIIMLQGPLTPEGFMGKLVSAVTQNGLYTLQTTPGSLSDAFQEGGMSFDTGTDAGSAPPVFTPAMPGIHVATPKVSRPKGPASRNDGPHGSVGLNGKHIILELGGEFEVSEYGQVKVDGWLDFLPDTQAQISDNADKGSHLHTTLKVTGDLRIKGNFNPKAYESPHWQLGSVQGPCFNVPIGDIPIPVCMRFALNVTLNIGVSMGLTFGIHYDKTVGVDCTANKSASNCTSIDEGPGFTSDSQPFLYFDGDATLNFPTDIQFLILGLAGPSGVITPYLELFADTTRPNWWQLRAGVGLGFSLVLSAVSKDYSAFRNDKMISYYVVVAQGGPFSGIVPDPPVTQIAPAQSVQLKVKGAGGPNPTTVQWQLIEGVGSVTPDGVYVSDTAGEAHLKAIAPPDQGHDELDTEAIVQVGTAYGAPGPPKPDLPGSYYTNPGVRDAAISWQPPDNLGASGLYGYALTVRPVDGGPISTLFAPGPGATNQLVQNLDPSKSYVISVFAVNANGTSPPATLNITPLDITFPGPPSTLGADLATSTENPGRPDDTGIAGGMWGMGASGDGRYITYMTQARSNLMPPDSRYPSSKWSWIVRQDTQTGKVDVASIEPDGQLTWGLESFPLISRDGNTIAFGSATSDKPNVYRGTIRDIAAGTSWNLEDGADPVGLSDNGQVILYTKYVPGTPTGSYDLYRQVHGSAPQKITSYNPYRDTIMSGDGNRIVYATEDSATTRGHIWLYDASTGSTTEPFAGSNVDEPVISGDGQTIAMRYREDATGKACMLAMRLGTGAPSSSYCIVPEDATGRAEPFFLSKDGTALAYRYIQYASPSNFISLRTDANGQTHIAGGGITTWPNTAFITDDNQRLIYTLWFNVPGPNSWTMVTVPGVWWDFTSGSMASKRNSPLTWKPGPPIKRILPPLPKTITQPPGEKPPPIKHHHH